MPVDATERLVNLALFLAAAREPVPAARVRAEVAGYPPDQDDAAFLRMFERDKDELRSAGFVIRTDGEDRYSLDADATFVSQVTLAADEAATLQAVGAALLEDPGFPFADELRFALAKVASVPDVLDAPDAPVASRLTGEQASEQARAAAVLNAAATARKRVSFRYTNSRGETKTHEVEPYGLFLYDGRWYAVGRDTEADEARVYAAERMRDLHVNAASPKTPDFERPPDFDVSAFIGLPFQYGPEAVDAVLRFEPACAWRAPVLARGHGELTEQPDGSVTWNVAARDTRRLLRWVIENGPGIAPVAPREIVEALAEALREVAALHA